MTRRNLLYVVVGLILGMIGSTHLPLHAQKPADAVATTASTAEGKVSLQEALLRPYTFAFDKPTPLGEVANRLTDDLGGAVVLDLAALERLDVKRSDTVELALQGARLKTGLKLLLDQHGLTYHVVAEDNLLIITDQEGAEDPIEKVWAELDHIHRDIHDIQDGVEELRELSGVDADGGPHLRRPTIIEDMPGAIPNDPAAPGAVPGPIPGTDEAPPASPPVRPRTSL